MATDIRSLPAYWNNDADFRTWGLGINAQFAAIGLIQAPDTGQINWTTVLRPAGSNVFAGYEIWRFNDSLQATKPVFIKIEYGSGNNAVRVGLAFTVATATNGAGTMTGQVGTRYQAQQGLDRTVGSVLNSYCSGSSSRLSFMNDFDPTSQIYELGILVERPRNAAGIEQTDYIVTKATHSGAFQIIPYVGPVPTGGVSGAIYPGASGMSVVGSDVALCPVLAFYGRMLFCSWLIYRHVDIPELTPITANHLGASHTFMPMGDGADISNMAASSDSGTSMAIRWE